MPAVLSCTLSLLLGTTILLGQPTDDVHFQVASVKPSGTEITRGGQGFMNPGLFSVRHRPLKALILMAYGISDFQLSGGPAWIAEDRFDVDARPATAASKEQMMVMLRNLLADRFGLRLHQEERPMTVFIL